MPLDYQIPQEMTYGDIPSYSDGDLTYQKVTPVSGQTFLPGQQLTININSSTHFLDTKRCFLSYDLKLKGGATTAGNCITTLGGCSVLQQVNTTMNGNLIETIQNYPTYVSAIYEKLPVANKNFLRETELYKNQTALTATADAYTNGRKICHPLRNGVFESDKLIPLPFVVGGLVIDIQLGQLSNLMCLATTTTSYEISNVEFICGMLRPSNAFLDNYQNTISGGRVGKIPIQKVFSVRSAITGSPNSNQQNLTLQTGYHRSLRSITQVEKLQSVVGVVTADEFNAATTNGLKSYQFRIGSQQFPEFAIQCNNDASAGTPSPMAQMMTICALDNTWAHLDQPSALTANTGNAQHLSFNSNPSFGAGVKIENNVVNVERIYNAAPANSFLDTFYVVDAMLYVDSAGVGISTDAF
jgi:hypothetical protein